MSAITALTVKDLRLLLRDKPGFFFTFFFPVLYGLFFGTIMSGLAGGDSNESNPGIPIVVVVEDDTDAARDFAASLEAESSLAVTTAATLEDARRLVQEGQRAAFVRIPGGFGAASERVFWGDPPTLEVGVDPTRSAERGMLQGILTKLAFERMQSTFTDVDRMRQNTRQALDALDGDSDLTDTQQTTLRTFLGSLDDFVETIPQGDGDGEGGGMGPGGWNPIEIKASVVVGDDEADDDGPAFSAYAIAFPQATIWGVMGAAAAFGISLVTERTRGTLMRLTAAPISDSGILLGKAGACFITTTIVATTMLTIMVLLGVRPGWDALPKLVIAVLCISCCFVGIMMMLSVMGKTEAAAGGIGWAVLIVMAMIGGGMIPLMFMKGWMITLSSLSPVKWSILAMEGAIWRGFDYGQMLTPCAVLIGVGVGGFIVGSTLFRRMQLD